MSENDFDDWMDSQITEIKTLLDTQVTTTVERFDFAPEFQMQNEEFGVWVDSKIKKLNAFIQEQTTLRMKSNV